jgi:hypothetical protein
MSSTNRSNARDTHISDYYVTPIAPIWQVIEQLKQNNNTKHLFNDDKFNKNLNILDPCAGGDKINPMSYPYALNKYMINSNQLTTLDIREDSLSSIKGNYLTMEFDKKFDLIITNPPFNIAIDVIRKSFEVANDGGIIIMLLRLNFFGTKERKPFFDNNMPVHTFVHHKRISFLKGATDSIEYMHTVWIKGINQNHTILTLI